MNKIKLAAVFAAGSVCLSLFAMPGTAGAEEAFAKNCVLTVPGGLNSFDIGFQDPVLARYFLADRTNKTLDVVDTSKTCGNGLAVTQPLPKVFVGVQANGENGPNGVITANNHTEVWAGDGTDSSGPHAGQSSVKAINLSTNAVTTIYIPHGTGRADELCEDPQHHLVLIANDRAADKLLTFIDTHTKTVVKQIKLDAVDPNSQGVNAINGIEQCQWSPRTNKIYLNVPRATVKGTAGPGVVLMINAGSMKIEKIFNVPSPCVGNQGMAIGPGRQILLGCSNAGTGSVIINELDGSLIASVDGLNGNDQVWYNPGDDHYFLAASNHTGGPVLGVVDAANEAGPVADANATTAAGSHSVASDPVHNQVFVPGNNAAAALCGGSTGCIAVFTTTSDDPGICVAEGAPVISMAGGEPSFLRAVCPPGTTFPGGPK